MRVIVVGLGVQGNKRTRIAGKEVVATVDNMKPIADYKDVHDIPLNLYDAALVCTADASKLSILKYLLENKKHVLVEKPLISESTEVLEELYAISKERNVVCYTAYNHRFEPHFMRMKTLLDSKKLGTIYRASLSYGNGTAMDVKQSPWRDQGLGVLKDLGSHLLDTVHFWFDSVIDDFRITRQHHFENKSPDYAVISSEHPFPIDLEMSLLSWKNGFYCHIIGENASAHIESLCKWGPSQFIVRIRQFPSGRPDEETITLAKPDPTWEDEYAYFKKLCLNPQTNLLNDIQINKVLQKMASGTLLGLEGSKIALANPLISVKI